MDDVWGDNDEEAEDGGKEAMEQGGIGGDQLSFAREGRKLYNDGYRIGKSLEEEKEMQRGFDVGFERGMYLGRASGKLFAGIRHALIQSKERQASEAAATADVAGDTRERDEREAQQTLQLKQLEALLMEAIPDHGGIMSDAVLAQIQEVCSSFAMPSANKAFVEYVHDVST